MKTAKITEIHSVREWEGQHGTVYFHKISLDNGDSGDIGCKTSGGVKVGEELNYEITQTEHGFRIKKVQQNNFRGGAQRGSNASFALSYAKDMAVAAIPLHPGDSLEAWTGRVLEVAEKFRGYLEAAEGKAMQQSTAAASQSAHPNGQQFQSTPIDEIYEPVAAGLTGLVTTAQLNAIRAIGRGSGIDPDTECEQLWNCSLSELSKKAASSFIDHLKKQSAQMDAPLRRVS